MAMAPESSEEQRDKPMAFPSLALSGNSSWWRWIGRCSSGSSGCRAPEMRTMELDLAEDAKGVAARLLE